MPDHRQHRGPHPEDAALFGPRWLPALRAAAREYAWLLDRGYRAEPALRVVGDHHQLHARQRTALMRAVCGEATAARRRAARVEIEGQDVVVDGFNALVSVEAALSGAVLLRGPDGLLRDLSSVHGSYRSVEESGAALERLVAALAPARSARWVLDQPVSNSGRVAALLREAGQEVALSPIADRAIAEAVASGAAAATADGPLVDRVGRHVALVDAALAGADAWVVDLWEERAPRP